MNSNLLSQYFYKVSAIDGNGEELISGPAATRCQAPAAPSEIYAYSYSGSNDVLSIELLWTPVKNATSYKIYFSDKKFSDEPTEEELDELSVRNAGNDMTDDGMPYYIIGGKVLDPAKYYYFRIKAISGCGESELSQYYDSASTGCLSPDVTVGLKAEAINDKAIKISWNKVENAVEYYLDYATDEQLFPYNTVRVSNTTYTHNVNTPSTTYYYRIRAKNDCGIGEKSVIAFATTECKTSPANTVSGVSAVALSKDEIEVTWDESQDKTVNGYQVYRSATADGTYSPVGQKISDRTNTKFNHIALSAGSVHFYKVRAINNCGTGRLSDYGWDKTFVECVEEGAFPAPTGVTATLSGNTVINISFDRHANADSYEIYRSTNNPANAAEGADVFANGLIGVTKEVHTPFSDTDIRPNTTYYYSVKAVNTCQNSAYSATANVTTQCVMPTSTNSTLSLTKLSTTKVGLSWRGFRNADSYEIYRSAGGVNNFTLLNSAALTDTFFIDTGLDSTVNYSYYVIGVNSCLKSTAKDVSGSIKTGLDCSNISIGTPNNINAVVLGGDKIIVSWNIVSGAIGYNVYRSTLQNSQTSSLIAQNVKGNVYEDKDENLSKTQAYYYWVAAVDSCQQEGGKGANIYNPIVICAEINAMNSINVNNNNTTATAIALYWSNINQATKYVIKTYKPTSADISNNLQINDNAVVWSAAGDTVSTNSYTKSGLNTGERYWFKATAINPCGDTSKTPAYRDAYTKSKSLGAVQNFSVGAPQDINLSNRLDLSWNKLPGAQYYHIYRATSASGGFSYRGYVYEGSNSPNVIYEDNGLNAGTTYWYQVTAFNSDDEEGTASVVKSAKTHGTAVNVPCPAPSAPTYYPDYSTWTGTYVKLNFASNFWSYGYEIQISTNQSNWINVESFAPGITVDFEPYNSGNDPNPDDRYWNIRGLPAGTYYFRARIYNDCGNVSSWVYTSSVTVPGASGCSTPAPQHVYSEEYPADEYGNWGVGIDFAFWSNFNLSSYSSQVTKEVQLKTDEGSWNALTENSEYVVEDGSDNIYHFYIDKDNGNLVKSSKYQIRVRIMTDGCSEWSDWAVSDEVTFLDNM